ncbi:hypothetical protein [Burkholderia vietnamiensis]|uniref:hypothetical protein n=1 Tax=Burkholderia vietnamiensis TaxID=60552 RepID=UPI001D14755F|nr:hypothetical protein [Burkholderia vietnamiensis]UEC05425.1 hypothetical protein LK462_35040 [Burkholderia vietnamiensis]
MSLTKQQATKAGRLYGLAMVALSDGVAMDVDEMRVMQASREQAEAALARLGYDKSQLLTIGDCIEAVRDS